VAITMALSSCGYADEPEESGTMPLATAISSNTATPPATATTRPASEIAATHTLMAGSEPTSISSPQSLTSNISPTQKATASKTPVPTTAVSTVTPMATVIADPASARRAILSNVTDFLYLLQDYELNAMGNSAYDLIIMDYAADGDDDTAFSRR